MYRAILLTAGALFLSLSAQGSTYRVRSDGLRDFATIRDAVNASANGDIFGNAGGDWTECIAGQLGENGNTAIDPLFCDAASGDYTLRRDSQCAPENNPECGGIGTEGVGCAAPVPVAHLRWGGIKWRYR